MRVEVLADRCQGHTVCNMHAEEIFGLDDEDGHAIVLMPVVPPELRDKALRAQSNCPELAIVVTEV